jgi:alpha/beta superfamily hydrolase
MVSRILMLFAVLAVCSGLPAAGPGDGAMELEQSVCGMKEPLLFWLWSRAAGSPDAGRIAGLRHIEDIAFETRDQRILRGYRLPASGPDGPVPAPRGYLLVMQGNAILADQIIGQFTPFAAAGFDVYVYDFRGYGRSDGRRRLRAIVSDYREILAALDAQGYPQHLVYAMSFGGIAFLDGLAAHGRLDRVVVDSTPSRLSDYGCPAEYDPVNHLPKDCSGFLFIVGRNDGVVTPAMSRELVDLAQQRGARVLTDPAFGHPFMEHEPAVHARRMQVIQEYLLGTADSGLR